MARWELCVSTTFESLPLSTCTHCQQKSYISKGIQPIFEIFASARRCWWWAFGWKDSGSQVFYFCNDNVETLPIDNIWMFATLNLHTVPEKSYISKGIQLTFEIFGSARRFWGRAFGCKVSAAQVFYFCNGKVRTLRIDNIWKFATFNLYTLPVKILYLQRYPTDFRNLCLSSKLLRVGICVESFRCAGILLLQWQGENFFVSTTFESLPLSTCTLCQEKFYISKGIQLIFEIFGSARRFWGWAFGRTVSCEQVFYFCNGKVKTLRVDNIWKFATFNLYTVPAKILYFQRYSTDFRNVCLSSKMLSVGIWVERFRYAGVLLCNDKVKTLPIDNIWKFATFNLYTVPEKILYLQDIQRIFEIFAWARSFWGWAFPWKVSGAQVFYFCNGKVKTLRIDNIWKFATFNLYTVPGKILHIQRYSNRSWKSLPHLETFMGGHLCVKFQVRRYFTFALARWKFGVSTKFESLPLSTCTLCQEKSCISKAIQLIFEIFAWARSFWGWAFAWEVSGAQVFYCCNGKVKTLRIDKIWRFATFNLYTVPAKILYLQRYSPDFRNLWLSSTKLREGIWVLSFRCAGILLLHWQGENFAYRQNLKVCHFQPVHCARKNPISPKVFNWFSKSWTELEVFEGGHLRGNFQVRRYFIVATARWKLCVSTKFGSLPLSTCTLCQQKSYIYKGIHPIFEIFDSAPRNWGRAFGWKVSGVQVFYFCNGKVKTLRIDNIWKFATFNLYTVPRKILYLQGYSTDFRNLRLSSEFLREGIGVERFRGAGILLSHWQGENFAYRQNLKVCHFQPVHCARKNPVSPKVFNWFSKSLPELEAFEGGHLRGKFQVRRYFIVAMARWKLCVSTKFEGLPLSTCTVCQQKSYIYKGIHPIFEIFDSAPRNWGRAFGF